MKVHGSRLKILLFNTNTRGPKGGGTEEGRGEGRREGEEGKRDRKRRTVDYDTKVRRNK